MRSYSKDLRERVVSGIESGLSRRETARRFQVGAATAVRWMHQWTTTGDLMPAVGKPSRSPLEAHAWFLIETYQRQPDITLEELQTALFEALGVTTGISSIHRFFRRREITFKKDALRHRTGPGRRRHGAGSLENTSALA